jgi:hypothetical protein
MGCYKESKLYFQLISRNNLISFFANWTLLPSSRTSFQLKSIQTETLPWQRDQYNVRRFQNILFTINLVVDKDTLESFKPPLIIVLLLEWVNVCYEYRQEAIKLKARKLGEEENAEEIGVIDPETINWFSDEVDDDDDDDQAHSLVYPPFLTNEHV